ncbi:MAG: ABC transporter substrate-binding protein [Deltaproteobacteria bacterium]|nr:ABC transporter substrate-binding protein [Deltaproteobacteria bacterium]
MRPHRPKWVRAFAVVITFAMWGAVAEAQQPARIPRIGYVVGASPSAISARIEAFRQGLRELGYVDGKNIAIDWRSAEGKIDRLPALAAELVRRKVDVIVSSGGNPTRAAKAAISTIPIVMTNDGDPVGTGLVASLARPGGNITGLSTFAPELSGKRLELLKETIPRRAEAVLVLGGPVLNSDRTKVVDLAIKNRLPATYNVPEFVEAGGLMSYGVNFVDLYRRAAVHVDKILKGQKPTDIPVEQPMKFDFIINLNAAKQIGLTIPPNVLVRANKVIR